MGLLGNILYPSNKTMAEDLNKKYQKLVDNNNLHNNLTNSYHALADPINTFDSYLMALLCMQYAIVYDEEKLADLPKTDIPKISESIGDRIESGVGLGISVVITGKSLYAMSKGVVNLYRNAGIYKAEIRTGFSSFKAVMQNGLDSVRLRLSPMRSGRVSVLVENNSVEMANMAEELNQQVENAAVEGALAEGEAAIDGEVAEGVANAAEAGELGEAAAAAAEGATTLTGALSAILAPAALVLIAVTEIISAVEAGELNEKLKKAEENIDSILTQQDTSIKGLKNAFSNLLKCAIEDIEEYNKLIKHELSLSPSKRAFFTAFEGYRANGGFSYRNLESYERNLLNIKDLLTINLLEKNADSDLDNVLACIRAQAVQDDQDTRIVMNIKSWLKKHNQKDINELYINEATDLFNVDRNRVIYCNKLRQFMNEFAQKMLPYHKAINQLPQKRGVQTKQPNKNPFDQNVRPDPTYKPDPNDFALPMFSSTSNAVPRAISISNKYIWIEKEYNLPLEFSCNFVCNANSDEFLPCFSKTKAEWASKDCDALCWYMSPHRHDFTFRTKLFRHFPSVKRNGPGFNTKVGKKYKMKCQIRSNTATYWIDDKVYATATYARGTIPSSGYIGFAVYGKQDIEVSDITITVL